MNRDHKHLISLLLGVFLVTAIVALGIYETRDIIKGPGITVEYPTRGELIVNPLIEVQGKVKNASGVYLNGRKIFITEQGRFKEKLLLLPGYNIITFTVEDRLKRKKEARVEVVFDNSGAPDSL